MRDPRFTWASATAWEADRDKQADVLVGSLGDLSALERHTADWVGKTLRRAPTEPGRLLDFLESVERSLDESSIKGVAFLRKGLDKSGNDGPESRAGQRLLGQLIGRAVASGLVSASTFDSAAISVANHGAAWQAYLVEFVAQVAQAEQPLWSEALAVFPSDPARLVRAGHFERVTVAARVENEEFARTQGLVEFIWGHETECFTPEEFVARARVLAEFEPARLALVLDSLPLREVRARLLGGVHAVEDRDLILTLLQHAMPVIEESQWTGRALALEALELGVRHAVSLEDRVRRRDDLVSLEGAKSEGAMRVDHATLINSELPDWLRRLFKIALGRGDGRAICTHFAAQLVREARSVWQRSSGWDVWRATLNALDSETSAQPLSVGEIRAASDEVGASGSAARSTGPYVIVAACLASDATAIWTWYTDELVAMDPWFCYDVDSGARTWIYASLASALLGTSDLVTAWHDAWRRLFGQRQSSRFPAPNLYAVQPSIHLLRVGFHLFLLKNRSLTLSDADARHFWMVLREHAYRFTASYQQLRSGEAPVVVECFAAGVILFGSDWSTTLDGFEDVVRSDLALRVEVAARQIQIGLGSDAVIEEWTRRGLDPSAAVAELEERAKITGKDLPDRLRSAIAELRAVRPAKAR